MWLAWILFPRFCAKRLRQNGNRGDSVTVAYAKSRRLRLFRIVPISILVAMGSPAGSPAQQSTATVSLNPTQTLGRRIFQQRCGVCHTRPTITSGIYGPALYRDIVVGNEDTIRQFIAKGSKRMPGFEFGLEPSEIDAVIAYLKTVRAPEKSSSGEGKDRGPID